MGQNYNLVQKNNKEDEEEIEEETIEFEEEKKYSSKKPKDSMLKYMVVFIALFFIVIIIVWISSVLKGSSMTYEEVEEVMKNAAISYFDEYSQDLPSSEGEVVEVDSSNLVATDKMKDLSKYVGKDKSCSGTVQVEKTGQDYLYTPYLDCGDLYKTTELYKKIKEQKLAKTGEYGLYNQNGVYTFRGENVNNYVQLDSSLWRIVKISKKNNIVLIKDDIVGAEYPYDDRYNSAQDWEIGFNTYKSSRLKEEIERMYNKPDKDLQEKYLSKNDKSKIVNFNMCVGKRSLNDKGATDEKECAQLEKVKVGFLTASEYMNASLDSNCTTILNNSCANYNYLVNKEDWWLVTTNSENSYECYLVNHNGQVEIDNASSYYSARPVIYLNEKVMFNSGNGTEEKPYTIK